MHIFKSKTHFITSQNLPPTPPTPILKISSTPHLSRTAHAELLFLVFAGNYVEC